jgi:methionine-rich copper-binding protein CopC
MEDTRGEIRQGVNQMSSHFMKSIAASLMLGLFAALALAHTTVISTSPKSGSVLDQSPAVIEINFREAARLTSVVVLEAGKPERQLEFTPGGSAVSFKLQDPQLAPGRNEIQWKALSHDGHAINGSLILTIKPAVPATH